MKKDRGKKRRIPPSRKRYEQDNPVVSFRVPRKDYDRFVAIRENLGMSHGDVYRSGLGVSEVKVRAEEEVRQEAYDKGFEEGIAAAIDVYMVTYPCSVCGKPIELDSSEQKAAASRYMREHGWGHADCVNRR